MPINKTNANADTDLSMSASPLWARKIEAIRNAAKGGASRRLTNSMTTARTARAPPNFVK
jgi:hypothetical protein